MEIKVVADKDIGKIEDHLEDIEGVTPAKLFNALIRSLGLKADDGDTFHRLEGNYVVTYTDVSRHGFPQLEETGRELLSDAAAEAIRMLGSPLAELVSIASMEYELQYGLKMAGKLEAELESLNQLNKDLTGKIMKKRKKLEQQDGKPHSSGRKG